MSTSISVFYGIGQNNLNKVRVFATPILRDLEKGAVFGSTGNEFVKVCNSLSEIETVPALKRLIAQRHHEITQQYLAA